MGSGEKANYKKTYGSQFSIYHSIEIVRSKDKKNSYLIKLKKEKLFDENGTVTISSIANHREKFLGKNAKQIAKLLNKHGYKTTIRKSIHQTSTAKIVINITPTKFLNISQIQVSKGSKRHGNVPYIKISTTNLGKFKIIDSNTSEYKTDGKESAKILFRRYK